MENQLVIFGLANELYGVDIARVESIITRQPITAIPHAPVFVEGVINLRGEILPIVDLRRRFGLAAEKANKDTRIIVVNMQGSQVGMIVDTVSEVLRASEEAIEPLSPLAMTVASAFIEGIVKVDDRLIILLDLGKILSTGEKASLQNFDTSVEEQPEHGVNFNRSKSI